MRRGTSAGYVDGRRGPRQHRTRCLDLAAGGQLRGQGVQQRRHGAAAGLHLTVTFAGDLPDAELAAATLRRGVKTQPLSWHAQRPHPPGLVLGYAANTASEIDEGVAAIGGVLRGRPGPA
ncbi:hypothetical protein [Micromonospora purpureochromogenes]|uniref:hypothetical protein n=1 Tax=Micromonospora purpureochromogenes TaxID=47872 RepID=UPI0018D5A063|nr:hypothetical protein [Micromonospora purpureochromogenes]